MIAVRNGRPGRARPGAYVPGRVVTNATGLAIDGLPWAPAIVRHEPQTWGPER